MKTYINPNLYKADPHLVKTKGFYAYLQRFMSVNPENKTAFAELLQLRRRYKIKLTLYVMLVTTLILSSAGLFGNFVPCPRGNPEMIPGYLFGFLIPPYLLTLFIVEANRRKEDDCPSAGRIGKRAGTFSEKKFPALAKFALFCNTLYKINPDIHWKEHTIKELEGLINGSCVERIRTLVKYERDLDPENDSVQKFRNELKRDLKIFSEAGFYPKDWKARFKEIEDDMK